MLLKMLNIIYVKKEKTYINSKFTMNAINLHGGHQIRFSRKYKRIPCQDPRGMEESEKERETNMRNRLATSISKEKNNMTQ